jgi:uncharacterized protein YjbJ (UPF0337 family)
MKIWDWIAGNWKELIGKIEEKWGKLTHDELMVAAGKREQLVGLLQKHYGYQRTHAEQQLDEFAEKLRVQTEKEVAEFVLAQKL